MGPVRQAGDHQDGLGDILRLQHSCAVLVRDRRRAVFENGRVHLTGVDIRHPDAVLYLLNPWRLEAWCYQ